MIIIQSRIINFTSLFSFHSKLSIYYRLDKFCAELGGQQQVKVRGVQQVGTNWA